MRLCIVTREFPPITAYTGGIGTTFAALAPALARAGHEVHVVTVTRGPTGTQLHDGVHVTTVRRPNPERLWFLEDAGWTLATDRAVRRLGRFDALFAAEWGGDCARYSARKPCGPLVTHLTTSLEQALAISPGWQRSARMRLRHQVQQRLERRQTERSDALIASSHAILDWTRRLWHIDHLRTVVLPNTVDTSRVRRAAQGPLPDGFPRDGAPVVVFSGRLEIRKGVHHLVPAMHHVWDSLPDAHLVLMGRDGDWRGGRMSDHLRELAGDRAGRLHVLGLQPLDRVYAGLRAADVVALPSLWENFALAAVEALCVGRPIVATTGSGYHDFIADGVEGVLVPPGRVEPLADALLRLLGDEELRSRMAIAAAARGDELDADRVAARYAEFLAEVAGR